MVGSTLQFCADRLSGRKGGLPSRPAAQLILGVTIMGDSNMNRSREKNNNWRGGEHISSHGYVKILVGIGHHLADSKGYAYNHRVIAEQNLGRRLLPNEKAHHKNENRLDNRPENIEVLVGNKRHLYKHRGSSSRLRLPDEPNLPVECLCGCGATFFRYDKAGRPRRYISGHNKNKGGLYGN